MSMKKNKVSPSSTTREQADWLRSYTKDKDISSGKAVREGLKLLQAGMENGGVECYLPSEPLLDRIPMVLLPDEQAEFLNGLAPTWGSKASVIRTALNLLEDQETKGK